ncbi:hypothetical protein K457DRAFT_135424 [Linnemannia elongata AG-77]|uniref:Uncharacterized protein n=1 Tax=Linnemannia elongata AG-77 TaxID=1314771 RepID=A0A197K373_9FUNG|nr:hypothetical protein K457DRAFT_135424 [Linnemannia elongata AG-77]
MLHHAYPAWHRPAQKGFFIVAVLLCIALPVVYGSSRRPRKISGRTLGVVLGTYFGLWALFSLVVRFLVPSPKVVTTLPTYTSSPIPTPIVLHSPSRPNAVPTSPAIRLHPAGSAVGPVTTTPGLPGSGSTPRVTVTAPGGAGGTGRRSARFAGDGDDTDGDINTGSSPYYSPSTPTSRTSHHSNNVTFQTRPRGYTSDSAEFPTFAAYRQSQHGNFEALAQRFKRAFAISQQTTEQQQQLQQMAMMQSPASNELSPSMTAEPPSYDQTTGEPSISSIPLTTTIGTTGTTETGVRVQTRSRSTSAASMFSDIAGRLRSGSLFSRSIPITATTTNSNNTATSTLQAVRTSTDPLHYPNISSGANSEVIQRNLLSSPSHSATYSSFPSSPATYTTPMMTTSTSTTVTLETMPALELLESQPPLSQTGHDRTPSSSPVYVQTLSSIPPPDREQHPLVHNSIFSQDEDDFAASLPQSLSHLISTEKHSEKLNEPTSPNFHHT